MNMTVDRRRRFALVGLITNLGLYFATHAFFTGSRTVENGPFSVGIPDLTTIQPAVVGFAILSALLLFWRKWSVLRVRGIAALLGVLASLGGLTGFVHGR